MQVLRSIAVEEERKRGSDQMLLKVKCQFNISMSYASFLLISWTLNSWFFILCITSDVLICDLRTKKMSNTAVVTFACMSAREEQ